MCARCFIAPGELKPLAGMWVKPSFCIQAIATFPSIPRRVVHLEIPRCRPVLYGTYTVHILTTCTTGQRYIVRRATQMISEVWHRRIITGFLLRVRGGHDYNEWEFQKSTSERAQISTTILKHGKRQGRVHLPRAKFTYCGFIEENFHSTQQGNTHSIGKILVQIFPRIKK